MPCVLVHHPSIESLIIDGHVDLHTTYSIVILINTVQSSVAYLLLYPDTDFIGLCSRVLGVVMYIKPYSTFDHSILVSRAASENTNKQYTKSKIPGGGRRPHVSAFAFRVKFIRMRVHSVQEGPVTPR